jgi:hypothetical protein
MGPAFAISRLPARHGLTYAGIDIGIHEAFAIRCGTMSSNRSLHWNHLYTGPQIQTGIHVIDMNPAV